MKTNSWLRVGLLTLSLCLALPAVAQRKKGSKHSTARKATPRSPRLATTSSSVLLPMMPMGSKPTSSETVRLLWIAQ